MIGEGQYLMPHPTPESRAGIASFPKLIPTNSDHPNAEYIDEIEQTLKVWDVPVLVMWADKDMAFQLEEGRRISEMVPDGRFYQVKGVGHYLQEDAGEEITARMITFLQDEAGIISEEA